MNIINIVIVRKYIKKISNMKDEADKDLNKLQSASWKGDLNKVIELCKPDKINLVDKEVRFVQVFTSL